MKKGKAVSARKVLILENIRSVHNVGAIFRTADAVGMSEVWLVGYTPTPIDRFGRARADLHKAALGAEKNLKWRHFKTTSDMLAQLRSENFQIFVLEQDKKSVDYKKVEQLTDRDVAVILGNEVDGVSREAIDAADVVAEIPMAGQKESLNVSVATGVLLFRWFDR